MSAPDVLVVGAGSLGLGLAVEAARRGTVACRARSGFLARATLDDVSAELVPPRGRPHLALVTVKAHDLDAALATARGAEHVVVIANGLPTTRAPVAHVAAIAWACATRLGRDTTTWRGSLRLLVPDGPEAEALARAFRGTGRVEVTVATETEVAASRLEKLAVSAGLNALSALHRIPPGRIAEDAALFGRAREVAEEIAGLAAARGAPTADVPELLRRAAAAMGDFEPSMLQDARRGASLELDAVLAAPLRELAARDLPRRALAALLSDLSNAG